MWQILNANTHWFSLDLQTYVPLHKGCMTEVRPCWGNKMGGADSAQQVWPHKHSREIVAQVCDQDAQNSRVWATHSHTVFVDPCGEVSADWLGKNNLSHITTSLMMHWWCSVQGLGHTLLEAGDSHLWAALSSKGLGVGFYRLYGRCQPALIL